MCSGFFFMQQTSYDVRISDWSSDVCSSDLRRLLELYLRGVAHDIEAPDGLAAAVARTEGVSAAFVKELVRRAVVAGLTAGEEVLTAERLDDALTDLLEHSAPILRSTLGANPEAAGAVGDREAVQSAVPGISPAGWSRL